MKISLLFIFVFASFLFTIMLIGAVTIDSSNVIGVVIDSPTTSSSTSDTNASTACTGLEYLAGDGTCQNITAVGDTDTNASTACSGTEVLLGNGTCVEGSIFDTDTNITEVDPFWSANYTLFNSSWGSTFNSSYYLYSNPYSFYNSTTFPGGADTNCSSPGNCPNILYTANESSLNVNSSNYWDGYNITNTTQFQNNGGTLAIVESWFTSLWNTIFGTKTTDDLTQGSTNKYDNQTWNQTKGNSLYVSRTSWTTIDNYPSGCAAGQAVRVIGDTLTCIAFTNNTDTNCSLAGSCKNVTYMNVSNTGNLNITGGNYSMGIGKRVCFMQNCSSYIYHNGTGLVLQG